MSEDYPEIPTSLPSVTDKPKPILYLPDGREVIVRRPVGFAGHPVVRDTRGEK